MLRQEGFRWADIERYFGVSSVALKRRRREYQLAVPVGENFDYISNDTLVARVLHDTPEASLNLILGASRARGLRITVVSPEAKDAPPMIPINDINNLWTRNVNAAY